MKRVSSAPWPLLVTGALLASRRGPLLAEPGWGAQPHLWGSHSHSQAVIFPSELPKPNKTNPFEAPIHLNKHYRMKSCLGPCRARLKPCLISALWKKVIKPSNCQGRLTPPLQMRYLTPALLTHVTSHFSKAGFGFEMPSLFLLKFLFTTENGFLNVLCARVYLL